MIDSYAFLPFSGSPSGSCLLVVSAVFFPFKNTWESGRFARPLETELGTQCSRPSVSRYLVLNLKQKLHTKRQLNLIFLFEFFPILYLLTKNYFLSTETTAYIKYWIITRHLIRTWTSLELSIQSTQFSFSYYVKCILTISYLCICFSTVLLMTQKRTKLWQFKLPVKGHQPLKSSKILYIYKLQNTPETNWYLFPHASQTLFPKTYVWLCNMWQLKIKGHKVKSWVRKSRKDVTPTWSHRG